MKFKNFFYWVIGLAILPFLWATLRELTLMVPVVVSAGIRMWWLYAFGAVSYLVFEKLLEKPMTLYVVGHELTHMVSGWMSGAKIHSFKATSKGGEVRMSKSNLFVALSPYIVPIYTLLLIMLYVVIRIWWKDPLLTHFFQFLLGVSMAFHLSMTAAAVHKKQPDLKRTGIFLSTILIATGNALIIGLFCVSLFKRTPTVKQFSSSIGKETYRVWKTGTILVKTEIQEQMRKANHPSRLVEASAG